MLRGWLMRVLSLVVFLLCVFVCLPTCSPRRAPRSQQASDTERGVVTRIPDLDRSAASICGAAQVTSGLGVAVSTVPQQPAAPYNSGAAPICSTAPARGLTLRCPHRPPPPRLHPPPPRLHPGRQAAATSTTSTAAESTAAEARAAEPNARVSRPCRRTRQMG